MLAAISSLLILYGIVVRPGPEEFPFRALATIPVLREARVGIYLVLLAAVGIAFGVWLAMWQEGKLRLGARGARSTACGVVESRSH